MAVSPKPRGEYYVRETFTFNKYFVRQKRERQSYMPVTVTTHTGGTLDV